MNDFLRTVLVALGIAAGVLSAVASEPPASPVPVESPGPHGGVVLARPEGAFEVTTDSSGKAIDLYMLTPRKIAPDFVRIRTPGGAEILLRAADPWQGMPHFRGVLISPAQLYMGTGSMKGLEFEFGIGK